MNRTSFSQISTWLRCPRLYRFRYLDGAKPQHTSLALLFGSAFHDTVGWEVERRKAGIKVLVPQLTETFTELFRANVELAEAPVEGDQDDAVLQAEQMLRAYQESEVLRNVGAAEVGGTARLTDDLELEGFVDFLGEDQDGRPEVIELKTSAKSWTQPQVDLSLQAAAYALLTGVRTIHYVVVTKAKSPKVQELRTEVDDLRIQRFRETAIEVEQAIDAGHFPRNPSPQNCPGCEFHDLCTFGKEKG